MKLLNYLDSFLIGDAEILTIEKPPEIGTIGGNGSVTWTPEANAKTVLELCNRLQRYDLLALWYATNGECKPGYIESESQK